MDNPHKRSAVRGYNASILQNPAVGSTFKTFFNLGVQVRKSGKSRPNILDGANFVTVTVTHAKCQKDRFYRTVIRENKISFLNQFLTKLWELHNKVSLFLPPF